MYCYKEYNCIRVIKMIDDLKEIISNLKVLDLSHTMENFMPRNKVLPPVMINNTNTISRDGFYNQTFTFCEHVGTHVDAPAHTKAVRKNDTIEKVEPLSLWNTAVVYRLCDLQPHPGKLFTAEDLLLLEERMGISVKKGEIALICYGMDDKWTTGDHWLDYADNAPGLDESAVKLLHDRGIVAFGSDSATGDFAVLNGDMVGESYGHQVYFLPRGIYIIECLKNLEKLPSRCYFSATPLKIKNGSGSQIRALAFYEED